MVAQFSSNSSANAPQSLNPLQQRLLAGLTTLPEDISLCLLDGNKKPCGAGWQNKPLTKVEVTDAIINGITLRNPKGEDYHLKATKIKGFGIITGTPLTVKGEKYFVVAIDQDGPSAGEKVTKLSGGIGLPKTVAFTSKREGRCQYLFLIPEVYAPNLQTKKLITQPKTETQELEQLEFRWTGLQSVLPPSVHPLTGEYVYLEGCAFGEVEIAIAPDWVIEQMLTDKAVSTPTPTPTPIPTVKPNPQWRDCDWALTYLEALSPSRADDYDTWVMVGMALHSTGDDSLLDAWDTWSQNSSKYKPGECDKKWGSFGKRSGRKLGTLGFMAKADGWRSPFEKPSGRNFTGGIGSGSGGNGGGGNNRNGTGGTGEGGEGGDGNDNGKVVKFTGSDPQVEDWVIPEIDKLIAQGVTGSHLTGKLNRLANASEIYVGELRKLYYERHDEADLENERGTHQGEIEKLLTISEKSLELSDYLPPDLAEPITLFCKWLAIRPAVALTALLAGMSSLHRVGTELVLHRNQNFRVPASIYAAIISPSGQRKSPTTKNLITLPLRTLRREKKAAYKAAMEEYEAKLKAWKEAEEKGEEPEKPKDPTLYYFTKTTGEAIAIQAAKDPDKPLLALIDELSGLFKSENSYRGGRGSDSQDLLSYFDGIGETVLRVTGINAEVDTINLSIIGTIQPEILKRQMEDCSDPDGKWARFVFVNQPLEAAILADDDGGAVQIHELITDLYRRIERIPEMEYRLSKEAFKRYQSVYNELERLRVTHPKPGMRAVFSKMEGYIGRLALNLHVLWELAAGKKCPDEEIPLDIMEKAIDLSKFYFSQVKLIHAESDDESLPAHIVKLIELSKRLNLNGKDGWIKAQTYREQFASKKRPSAQKARDWMLEATTLGFGRTRGSGNRLEYHWMKGDNDDGGKDKSPPTPPDSGNLGKRREDLGNTLPYVENVDNKGVEDNLGKLGNLGKIFEKTSPTPTGEENSLALTKNGGDTPSPEKELTESYLPKNFLSSLSSLNDTLNANAVDDTNLGNSFPNPYLTFPNSSLSEEKPPNGNLGNHSPNPYLTVPNNTETEIVENAKRQGKTVQRYVGPLTISPHHSLAPNTLVERLGVDCFGVLVAVQSLGEVWETPINVGEKWLEEV